MSAGTFAIYRRALFGAKDDLFDRCLTMAAVVGALWCLTALLVPARKREPITVDALPQRVAKLIVAPPKTAPPKTIVEAARPAAEVVAEPAPGALPPVEATTPPPQVRRPGRDLPAPVDPNAGAAGRALAQSTVSAELAGTSQALSSALEGLGSSLATSSASGDGGGAAGGGRDRGTRGVRAARAATGVGAAGLGGAAGGGGNGDLGGSAIRGSRVAVGSLLGYGGGGVRAAGAGEGGEGANDGTGSAPGVYRSNASLLAVIQKYAAGIHYCYTNELKHDPALRGKLVFALTVSASGDVTEATVVENTLKSPRLTSCALAQVREWKFPAVPRGSTAFQAPFVFTPPE